MATLMPVQQSIIIVILGIGAWAFPYDEKTAGMPAHPHLDYAPVEYQCQITAPELHRVKNNTLNITKNASRIYLDTENTCYFYNDTGNGIDVSPALSWAGMHPMAVTTAIVMSEVTSGGGVLHYWGLYDLHPNITSLKKGVAFGDVVTLAGYGPNPSLLSRTVDVPTTIKQAMNSFGQVGYHGPCPGKNDTHTYVITVYNLDVSLYIPLGSTVAQMLKAMKSHILMKCSFEVDYGYYGEEAHVAELMPTPFPALNSLFPPGSPFASMSIADIIAASSGKRMDEPALP